MMQPVLAPEWSRDHLVKEYTQALRAFLGGGGEAALSRAYELGRVAVTSGIGVVDLVLLHSAALEHVGPMPRGKAEQETTAFLAESLSPFEMTHRGFRDAATRLERANRALQRKNDEVEASTHALREAKEATEAANRELEAFSYSVAHDLRAPLRAMSGFAQMLLDTYEDRLDAEGQDWLGEILVNSKRMGGLIDGLLSLSRLSRGELRPERLDLSAIARDTAAQHRLAEPRRVVELVVQEGLYATVDLRLARALFENLLGNAWKFTSKVPAARIEFGVTTAEGPPVFFVRDNGAGFDMTYADKLFTAFQRLHTADEFPGTGIGLATVQRIVRRHGGRIWAEGSIGGGATFYFTFGSPTASTRPRET